MSPSVPAGGTGRRRQVWIRAAAGPEIGPHREGFSEQLESLPLPALRHSGAREGIEGGAQRMVRCVGATELAGTFLEDFVPPCPIAALDEMLGEMDSRMSVAVANQGLTGGLRGEPRERAVPQRGPQIDQVNEQRIGPVRSLLE